MLRRGALGQRVAAAATLGGRSRLQSFDLSVTFTEGRGRCAMATDEQQPTAEEQGTSVLMEISNVIVRLYKDQFGRGPTSARTHWAGPDMLVTVLENTL